MVTIQYEICSSTIRTAKTKKNCCLGGGFFRSREKALFFASVVNQCDLVREATTSWGGIDGTRTTGRDSGDENAK